jgi:methylase of polypeptide subunit release factors
VIQRQFFEQYSRAFAEAERSLASVNDRRHAGQRRLSVQTLFNRLLFLRFLEFKNWLSFAGRLDYLRALFAAGGIRGQTVYRSRIVPLFRTLSGGARAPERLIGNVPALPGGPFGETDGDYQASDLPDQVLAHLIGERGLLYAFPFALDESPLAVTTGSVNPQVLGTVFEELMTARNESGAYYTPRPVVSFMCREALKCYLADSTTVANDSINQFVDARATTGLDRADACQINAALDDLRAIDPACGSGAYLVGLLLELVELYDRLVDRGFLADRCSRYELKRRIIGKNLYGVDIDPVATDIARWRLWLSLAVDANEPCRLPDLDDRIKAGNALAARFPLVSPAGGFGMVLANPPYVRQELINRADKKNLQQRFAAAVNGQSDLYCYFFARSLDLLRDGGVFVCICSGSWLDARFGSKLQAYLLSQARIVAIYDSREERQFASAAINTVISVICKQSPSGSPPTRFVVLQEPLADSGLAPAARREISVSREELWNPGAPLGNDAASSRPYRGGKWSGRYLRAPESLIELLRQTNSLAPLGQSPTWSLGRGLRTGCDEFFYLTAAEALEWKIEKRFLKTLVKSPTQFQLVPPCTSRLCVDWYVFLCPKDETELRGTNALRYIRAGREHRISRRGLPARSDHWYDLGTQPIPDLILPIAFHERFFVVVNDTRAVAHQRFATIRMRRGLRHWIPALAALLSSSLIVLLAEVLGRHGLGQGALDFPPEDWRAMPIPDVTRIAAAHLAELTSCWTLLAARPPLPFSAAAQDVAQHRLDAIVARLIGRDESFMEAVRRDALNQVEARIAKSRAAAIV